MSPAESPVHDPSAGGAGLRPAGAQIGGDLCTTEKEAARGGTMGSPTSRIQRVVEHRPLYLVDRELS